jgi:hypothetical protein
MTANNETLANEDTGSSENNNQASDKFYTQKEVDDMMARTKNAVTKKFTSRYEDLGDIDELRQLKQNVERQKIEEQKKRGEFDTILQDLARKKDEEIRKRDEIIRNYTVDVPLVSAAAQFRAVNAEQVKSLLKPQVRLNESGEVEVLDNKGTVRYNDQGLPFQVQDLVKEFLDTNPHFVAAGASTTQGRNNVNQSQAKLDLSKLDMKNPDHRKLYKENQLGIKKH